MSNLGPLGGRQRPMMLPTPPQGMTIARYSSYAEAQRAVDFLSDSHFPVQVVTIVGTGLRMVERVTGRLTYAQVALAGASGGAWFGLFVGVALALISDSPTVGIAAAAVLGAGFGLLFGLMSHWMYRLGTGGNRDFSSMSQIVAGEYQVLCLESHARAAMDVLGRLPTAPTPGWGAPQGGPAAPGAAWPPPQQGGWGWPGGGWGPPPGHGPGSGHTPTSGHGPGSGAAPAPGPGEGGAEQRGGSPPGGPVPGGQAHPVTGSSSGAPSGSDAEPVGLTYGEVMERQRRERQERERAERERAERERAERERADAAVPASPVVTGPDAGPDAGADTGHQDAEGEDGAPPPPEETTGEDGPRER